MVAIDTNVIVRIIVADDPDQLALALALASRDTLYVSLTVLIETDWVLRSAYGLDRKQVCDAITAFRQAFDVTFEAGADVRWALSRYAAAGELADYVHIAASRPIGRFATFERQLARRAGADAPTSIETLR